VLIEAQQEGFGGGRAEDFVQQGIEQGVGGNLKAVGRLAHLLHALGELGHVLGAIVRVEAEGHLQLIDGHGGDARDQRDVQAFERPVDALDAVDRLGDGEPGGGRVTHGEDAGKRRQAGIAAVVVDGSRGAFRIESVSHRVHLMVCVAN